MNAQVSGSPYPQAGIASGAEAAAVVGVGVGVASVAASGVAVLPTTPLERLEQSRERLRLSLRRSAGLDRPARVSGQMPAWATAALSKLRSIPGIEAVFAVLRGWWANHPLRKAALVTQEAVQDVATPLAQRQPVRLALGALVFGAVLTRLRPWRWLPRAALFAGLLPQLAVKLITSVPVESWLHALSSSSHKARHAVRIRGAARSPS